MEPSQPHVGDDVTDLLRLWSAGDEQAFDRLIPLVYDELHRMALRYLAGERSNVSLQATALVNEVCLRLLGWDQARWQNRSHFYGVSAQMMRRVLVDIARRRRADRRGGAAAVRVPLESVELSTTQREPDLVAIDLALEKLAVEDPRKARVVELRFFGGLSMEETARVLDISVRTAHSDWAFARAWLYRALSDGHAKGERAAASEPRERSGDHGDPASERVGGTGQPPPPSGFGEVSPEPGSVTTRAKADGAKPSGQV